MASDTVALFSILEFNSAVDYACVFKVLGLVFVLVLVVEWVVIVWNVHIGVRG